MAWDRADGKAKTNPCLFYKDDYLKRWTLLKIDGKIAYICDSDADYPPTKVPWKVSILGTAPAPRITLHDTDPRIKVLNQK